jgi:sortase A
MGLHGTRSLGTLLMGVGLVMILSVGGYFAWNEVQASQVRSELEQGSAAAAARATRMAQELALSTPQGATASLPVASATPQPAQVAKAGASPAAKAALPTSTTTPTRRPTATKRPTAAATATAAPPVAAVAASPAPAPLLPVRLQIPDLKIDTKVEEMGWNVVQTKSGPVSEWALPKNDAGHHINSASIGQPDNLVISGHNNIFGRVFMPISQAWTNDKRVKVDNYTDKSDVLDGRELILFDAAGAQHKYVITDFLRLKDTGVPQQQREANGHYMLPTGDERVTIITCWPPTNNTHRLVVIARPEK